MQRNTNLEDLYHTIYGGLTKGGGLEHIDPWAHTKSSINNLYPLHSQVMTTKEEEILSLKIGKALL
jgi:hypothetical protein